MYITTTTCSHWSYCLPYSKESRITSSTDNLNEVDTPLVQLRSFRKNRLMAQTKESLQRAAEEQLSNNFLESECHKVFHNFPWERVEVEEPDAVDGRLSAMFSPRSTISRRSRIGSDGSEDVFEPVEVIKMDEEADQDQRQKQAERKWNLRRFQIESEIQRLKNMSLNRDWSAMKRHSVASFGQELEEQAFSNSERKNSLPRKRYMSTFGEGSTELLNDGSAGFEIEGDKDPPTLGKPPFARAASLPTTESMFSRLGESGSRSRDNRAGVPTLETYEEEEEEHVEMMGLPPKDIPHFRKSMEELDRIDYSEIPLEHLDEDKVERWTEV